MTLRAGNRRGRIRPPAPSARRVGPTSLRAAAVLVLAALAVGAGPARPTPAHAASPATVAARGRGPTAAEEGGWRWPVAPPWRIVAGFRAPQTRYSAGHRGIDIVAHPGQAVTAVADGVVVFAGRVVDRPVISIRHADGVIASMEPVVAAVAVGDALRAGEPIGVVGRGGHCSGTCVHLGVRREGRYVSPLRFLAALPRAVLLPLW